MTAYLSILVSLVGAVAYLMASHPRASELARLAFACGLLAFLLLGGAENTVRLLK